MGKISAKLKNGLIALCALLSVSAGVFSLTTNVASADSSTLSDALILPERYEEYLPLKAPTDVAVTENYTAISDGNLIYVYDRKADAYGVYTHAENGNATMDAVKKLQFGEDGNLYFVDNSSGANFYALDTKNLALKQKFDKIACGTFALSGENVYFTNSQGQLCHAVVTDETANPIPLMDEHELRKPTLAFWNNELYFTDNGAIQILYKINPASSERPTPVATPETRIEYMSVSAGVLSYTTSSGDFYAYSLNDVTETGLLYHDNEDTHTSLSSFGEKTYVVSEDKIKCFSTFEKAFTGYEICSSSDSFNRLNGATDVAMIDDTLWIADSGNSRVSAYDTKAKEITSNFDVSLPPLLIAGDGETVLTATASTATVYSVLGEELFSASAFKGNVIGVTGVYGKYYLSTSDNYFYTIEKEETGWTETEIRKTSTRYPDLLTSDIYGNLYIKSGTYLYSFTESEFIIPDSEGVEICDNLPAFAEKIHVDFDKNVYALQDSVVYKNGEEISFNAPLVYGTTVRVTAFAFGVEENETYLLCDGNYLIQSQRLDLPTVKTISVNGADEKVFANESAEISVVETKENALLIAFDLSSLSGETYFPYITYMRATTSYRALKIGEAGAYALVAIFDSTDKSYDTYILLNDSCSVLPTESYSVIYSEEERKTAYITNETTLYKFPYLTSLLTVRNLPRNGKVTLLGEINDLDQAYYYIAYGEYTGYVPKSFVSNITASPAQTEETVYGNLEDNVDAIFRVTYIILGFGVICILVDFLLLRKKEK